MTRRAYQTAALEASFQQRMFALLWERQAGKSTTFADMALLEMMRVKWRTVIYASASLLLAQEIVLKQSQRVDMSARELVEKDASILQAAAERYSSEAKSAGLLFQTADTSKDKVLGALKPADFADLFEAQRLEFRVYHDRSVYSRTKIIAPNVATARSWSGTVLLDEVAFIRAFKELMTALTPVISTNPEFKLVLSTTPPQNDDTHYSFELLSPPPGAQFPINPAGNWYESELGVRVHRADCYDTHAAGKKIYDLRTGKEITPDEAFAKALNKDGHRINHQLRWMAGGNAACDLLRLKTAQERGIGHCLCQVVDTESDFHAALRWLSAHISQVDPVGLGLDVATTTSKVSNPSVLSVLERSGPEIVARLVLVWKTKDPDIARERVQAVIRTVAARKAGRARALAVDATNEKYFAEDLRKQLRAQLPVLLVVASESLEKPGLEKATNWKEYLGDQYVAVLDDNHLTLPPDAYLRIDHRLVRKEKGRFVCEPDEDGRHGDTFDGNKLALHALTSRGGPVWAQAAATGSFTPFSTTGSFDGSTL